MELSDVQADITKVLYTEQQLQERLAVLARQIESD